MELWLARHGATEWSESGRHTGRTDLPLLPAGEARARELGTIVAGREFTSVFTSPLRRAEQTAELAGFAGAERTDLLREFDYGDYEGLTSAQIEELNPGWQLFRDGCPGGESPDQVLARATSFTELAAARGGRVLAFAHGHVLRAVAVAWLGLGTGAAGLLELDTATLSILVDGSRGRQLRLWNGLPM
ncbi:MAG TPA: histidine phosphatase family protein [Candidatus Dormibacteraeota bacterium]